MSTMDSPTPIPAARLLFSLDAGVAHLNHGAFGAVPIGVQRAQQRLRDELTANPSRFFTVGLEDRIAHARRHFATFLGADAEGSALVDNATTGMAIVFNSMDFKPGDEIVTTDHGYAQVELAITDLGRHSGVVHRLAKVALTAADDVVVDTVQAACTSRTRLVVIDAITSPTARTMPAAAVVAALRGSGIAVLVDAAHSPGLLSDPVARLGADFWVGNLHKWAFAPPGTALLAVAPEWRDRIRAPIVSWQHAAGFPASVESLAARDYTPWLAAPQGLFTLRALGLDAVREHNAALAAYGQQIIGSAIGATQLPDGGALPMRVVPLPPGIAADPASAAVLRRRIADELATQVAVNGWHGTGLLRLSAQVYNRAEEYERLAAGLTGLLRHHSSA